MDQNTTRPSADDAALEMLSAAMEEMGMGEHHPSSDGSWCMAADLIASHMHHHHHDNNTANTGNDDNNGTTTADGTDTPQPDASSNAAPSSSSSSSQQQQQSLPWEAYAPASAEMADRQAEAMSLFNSYSYGEDIDNGGAEAEGDADAEEYYEEDEEDEEGGEEAQEKVGTTQSAAAVDAVNGDDDANGDGGGMMMGGEGEEGRGYSSMGHCIVTDYDDWILEKILKRKVDKEKKKKQQQQSISTAASAALAAADCPTSSGGGGGACWLYLCKWKHYAEPTWESREDLEEAGHIKLLDDFDTSRLPAPPVVHAGAVNPMSKEANRRLAARRRRELWNATGGLYIRRGAGNDASAFPQNYMPNWTVPVAGAEGEKEAAAEQKKQEGEATENSKDSSKETEGKGTGTGEEVTASAEKPLQQDEEGRKEASLHQENTPAPTTPEMMVGKRGKAALPPPERLFGATDEAIIATIRNAAIPTYRSNPNAPVVEPYRIYRYGSFKGAFSERIVQKWRDANGSLVPMLLFHGTKACNLTSIARNGFLVGGQGVKVSNGSVYGVGVYTARTPFTCHGYNDDSYAVIACVGLVPAKADMRVYACDFCIVFSDPSLIAPMWLMQVGGEHITDEGPMRVDISEVVEMAQYSFSGAMPPHLMARAKRLKSV